MRCTRWSSGWRARGVPRVLAVIAGRGRRIVALLALLLLIVPILSKELPLLREQMPLLAERSSTQTLAPWLAQFGINVSLDTASIKAFVVKYLDANFEDWLAAALSSARIGGSFAAGADRQRVLMPVVLFYLLIDWQLIVERAHALVPPRAAAERRRLHRRMRRGARPVPARPAAGDGGAGRVLQRRPGAVRLRPGAAGRRVHRAGACSFPTSVSASAWCWRCSPGVLQFASWYGVIAVAVVYGIGQVVESFVLTPRLVGERIGLNPLAVIFALLAFGHLFGFVGVLSRCRSARCCWWRCGACARRTSAAGCTHERGR